MRSIPTLSRLALLLAGAWTCGGCFAVSTVVTVKGDGSGTIQQRVLLPPAARAQIRGLAGRGNPAFEPMSEQEARVRTTTFGTGVTYVSSTPIDTSDGQGRDIIYAFTDIAHVRLGEQPRQLDGVTLQAPDGINSYLSFALVAEPGGNVLLQVHVPPLDILDGAIPGVSGAQIPPDQIAMFRQMFAGAHLSIAVEPAGDLVRTTSPYVDGRRVTLIDLDVEDLLSDEVVLRRLQAAGTPDAVKTALQDLQRAKVIVDQDVTIEFSPAN